MVELRLWFRMAPTPLIFPAAGDPPQSVPHRRGPHPPFLAGLLCPDSFLVGPYLGERVEESGDLQETAPEKHELSTLL